MYISNVAIILFNIIIQSSLVGEIEKRVGELWVEINARWFGFFYSFLYVHSCFSLKCYKFVSVLEMYLYVSVCASQVCLIVDVGAIGIKYSVYP